MLYWSLSKQQRDRGRKNGTWSGDGSFQGITRFASFEKKEHRERQIFLDKWSLIRPTVYNITGRILYQMLLKIVKDVVARVNFSQFWHLLAEMTAGRSWPCSKIRDLDSWKNDLPNNTNFAVGSQLSNLWWMPSSVCIGFGPPMKTGSSRGFERYPN